MSFVFLGNQKTYICICIYIICYHDVFAGCLKEHYIKYTLDCVQFITYYFPSTVTVIGCTSILFIFKCINVAFLFVNYVHICMYILLCLLVITYGMFLLLFWWSRMVFLLCDTLCLLSFKFMPSRNPHNSKEAMLAHFRLRTE